MKRGVWLTDRVNLLLTSANERGRWREMDAYEMRGVPKLQTRREITKLARPVLRRLHKNTTSSKA